MTRDDIIRMALEAGFTDADNGRVWITDGYWDDEIKRFATLVAAKEREQCAKRLEAVGCNDCAENIRLRGQNV